MCRHLRFADGAEAILCGGRGPELGRFCKLRPAEFLCDWKLIGACGRTCDAGMCAECAVSPAENKHLCPFHARAWESWKRAHPEHPAVAQMSLAIEVPR